MLRHLSPRPLIQLNRETHPLAQPRLIRKIRPRDTAPKLSALYHACLTMPTIAKWGFGKIFSLNSCQGRYVKQKWVVSQRLAGEEPFVAS